MSVSLDFSISQNRFRMSLSALSCGGGKHLSILLHSSDSIGNHELSKRSFFI